MSFSRTKDLGLQIIIEHPFENVFVVLLLPLLGVSMQYLSLQGAVPFLEMPFLHANEPFDYQTEWAIFPL